MPHLPGPQSLSETRAHRSAGLLTTWGWVFGYTIILAGLSIVRHRVWLTTGGDLGWFEQGLWLLTHRGIQAISTINGHAILADTASYILVPLAPLYSLGHVNFLLALQAFAFGLGYFFIHGIGCTLGVGIRWTRMLGLIYLAHPTILGANLFDFHPDALGVPILFGLAWVAIRGRWPAYVALAGASVLIKDTVPILLLGMGLALILQRKFSWGFLTMAIGLAAAYVDVQVVIPALSHQVMKQWQENYGYLGATPLAGVIYLILHPANLLNWVGRLNAWFCLIFLLGPLAPVLVKLRIRALNSWWLPGLALCEVYLLSPNSVLSNPFNEEYVMALPFFFVATLAGLRKRAGPEDRGVSAWLLVPVFLLLAAYVGVEYPIWMDRPPNASALQAAIAVVPQDAPVLTQNFIAPHVADRPQVWITVGMPETVALPAGAYVILDPSVTRRTELTPPSLLRLIQRLLSVRGQAKLTFAENGVTVYRLSLPLVFSPSVEK